MAMSGEYSTIQSGGTPTGYCTGSYSICLNLGTDGKDDLCRTLDQYSSNQLLDSDRSDMYWLCSQEELPCHGQASATCPIETWCFSPDVFALSFVEEADACSEMQDIPCASISMDAIGVFLERSENSTAHEQALSCLVDRCDMYSLSSLRNAPEHTLNDIAGYGAAILGMCIAALVFIYRTFREPPDTETVCRHAKEDFALNHVKVLEKGAIECDATYMLQETNNGAIHQDTVKFDTAFLGMLLSAVVVLFRTALVDRSADKVLPESESEAETQSQR
jgi:hypothetical protein